MRVFDSIPEQGISCDDYFGLLTKASKKAVRKYLGRFRSYGDDDLRSLEHPIHWALICDTDSLNYVQPGQPKERPRIERNGTSRKKAREYVTELFQGKYGELITSKLNAIS